MGGERSGETNPPHAHELFKNIAQKYRCSKAVVALSWAVQRGVTVIPKSSSKARIEENIKLATLSNEEMSRINDAYRTIARFRCSDLDKDSFVVVDGKKTFHGWSYEELGWTDQDGNWLT